MEIDVYDFDGTIYDGDSTVDFVRYCLRRHPSLVRYLPGVALAAVKLALVKGYGLTRFKTALFRFARHADIEALARDFWKTPSARARLGAWFEKTPRDLPVVIASASPEFELAPIVGELGAAALVGTRVNVRTGEVIGKNNRSQEKIARIRALYGQDVSVRAMYTDSLKADGPLVEWAREGYLLRHGRVQRIK
jgi:phosphatidylglycerophosphatase C